MCEVLAAQPLMGHIVATLVRLPWQERRLVHPYYNLPALMHISFRNNGRSEIMAESNTCSVVRTYIYGSTSWSQLTIPTQMPNEPSREVFIHLGQASSIHYQAFSQATPTKKVTCGSINWQKN
jgi:hypothetical protein